MKYLILIAFLLGCQTIPPKKTCPQIKFVGWGENEKLSPRDEETLAHVKKGCKRKFKEKPCVIEFHKLGKNQFGGNHYYVKCGYFRP